MIFVVVHQEEVGEEVQQHNGDGSQSCDVLGEGVETIPSESVQSGHRRWIWAYLGQPESDD